MNRSSSPAVPAAVPASQRRAARHSPRIESLLAARLFLGPQSHGSRLYFISNLSGRLSLYAMDHGGSVPEPLLPPHVALHNPHLIGGLPYHVFPTFDQILIMIDRDGDEVYQPMRIPLAGGFPEPAFGDALDGRRTHLIHARADDPIVYMTAQRLDAPVHEVWRADLRDGSSELLHEGRWGNGIAAVGHRHHRLILVEGYAAGDNVLYLWRDGERHLLLGTPIEQRAPDETPPPTGFYGAAFTAGGGILVRTALFDDRGTLGYLDLAGVDLDHDRGAPHQLEGVTIAGVAHKGLGELVRIEHLEDERFLVGYNIDGVSWLYEGRLDEPGRILALERVLVGEEPLAGGVIEADHWDEHADRITLSHSTATTPTQIYTLEGARREVIQHTRERVLGLSEDMLAPGEDASFTSFDGLRVSARLYRPSPALGFEGPRPLVYYVHGGPQGQERPDFAWFSMPLIQYLTLHGFSVFVPNARGSSGYGIKYMKRVDRDWGGEDRLDHVHAMTRVLPQDSAIDTGRAAVVGRSYGGYMTLTLAARHPELWAAACDMFGPYDLLTFQERIPETWKPYFRIALGDPDKPEERELLIRRSPRSHIDHLSCPLMVIQGANDPRVVAAESRDLVAHLGAQGKEVDYLELGDEGHDVLKHENRVRVYDAIADFFIRHLSP